jgi:hypothetical protein
METEGTLSSAWDQHLASEFAAKPPRAAAGVMRQNEPGRGDPIGPLDWRKILPFEPCAPSDRPGWAGLEAARFRAASASGLTVPALTHHRLVLIARPPEELDLLYDGVKRHIPPPAGAILVIPAGSQARWRWSGRMETFIDFLYTCPVILSHLALRVRP